MFWCLALLVGPTVTLKANLCHFLFFIFLHVFPAKFLPVRPPHSVFPSCQFVFPSPSRAAPAEERGGFVPPTLARDEWNPGPEEAGAGGPPHPRPHEGRQAAHHGQIGLGQRVSRGRGSWLFKHAIAMMAQGSFTVFGRFHLRGSCPWIRGLHFSMFQRVWRWIFMSNFKRQLCTHLRAAIHHRQHVVSFTLCKSCYCAAHLWFRSACWITNRRPRRSWQLSLKNKQKSTVCRCPIKIANMSFVRGEAALTVTISCTKCTTS